MIKMTEIRKLTTEELNKKLEENKKELENYTELFIASKKVEGCSDRTLNYYQTTIDNMLEAIKKNLIELKN